MAEVYDLVVVGGGTAGIVAAKTAGRLGASVVLIERDRTGGDCLWTGCVPSKALIAAAATAHRMRTGGKFGIGPVEPKIDFAAVMAHVHRAIERIEPIDSPQALAGCGAEVVSGTAVFSIGADSRGAGLHGSIAATNALLAPLRAIDHDTMPWVTFTDPEIAHVGLTEEQARSRHGSGVRSQLLTHDQVDRAITEDDTDGFTQVVLDGHGRVLGATIVAPRAGEMLAELTGVIARRGRLRDLASVVHPYPTWGDGVWNAALAQLRAAMDTPTIRRTTRMVARLRRGRPRSRST